jgi:hypothetical protein
VKSNLTVSWDESFADDLVVCGGAVSSRVALLLRSAEANPFVPRFVYCTIHISSFFFFFPILWLP